MNVSVSIERDRRPQPDTRAAAQEIFERVHELAVGGAFVLVNDHDPKPLYYQLEAEYPHQFSWTYLERGPDVWRVEIGRQRKAA